MTVLGVPLQGRTTLSALLPINRIFQGRTGSSSPTVVFFLQISTLKPPSVYTIISAGNQRLLIYPSMIGGGVFGSCSRKRSVGYSLWDWYIGNLFFTTFCACLHCRNNHYYSWNYLVKMLNYFRRVASMKIVVVKSPRIFRGLLRFFFRIKKEATQEM